MEFKDYYKVLGVERTATPEEIKKAYRRAARKFHPDVSKEPDAAARMSEVNEANTVLSDPEKRASYDELGNRYGSGDAFQPPPDWGRRGAGGAGPGRAGPTSSSQPFGADSEDFSDFFSSLFGRRAGARGTGFGGGFEGGGGGFNGGFGAGETPSFRGNDQHARIEIGVADAYRGATRTLGLRSDSVDASGRPAAERTLEVRIPKGVREGQLIRLAGQGTAGFNGGASGDLYLEIHFTEDPRYRVVERDVYQKLPVAPWEAALGATIEVPTLAGRLEIRVPADSQTGRKLRLRGKGLPAGEPGDLYLELDVVLPSARTEAARKLYETMAREMQFDPRSAMEDGTQ